jgi:hypothetical protein
MKTDLKIAGKIEALELKPGDIIVVSFDDTTPLTPEILNEILAEVREYFPEHRVVAIGGGMRLTAVRPTPRFAV